MECGGQISCSDFSSTSNSNCMSSDCMSGCFCSNEIIFEDGICIHPDTCPSK